VHYFDISKLGTYSWLALPLAVLLKNASLKTSTLGRGHLSPDTERTATATNVSESGKAKRKVDFTSTHPAASDHYLQLLFR